MLQPAYDVLLRVIFIYGLKGNGNSKVKSKSKKVKGKSAKKWKGVKVEKRNQDGG